MTKEVSSFNFDLTQMQYAVHCEKERMPVIDDYEDFEFWLHDVHQDVLGALFMQMSKRNALKWLTSSHIALGGKDPVELLAEDKARIVALIEGSVLL